MSITTSTGIFSGIDTQSLINQLIAIEARPRDLANQRILALSSQQAAYLNIASSVNSLENIARGFRTSRVFDSSTATSSNDAVLTATASNTASPGNLSFVVDRLVTTQQLLSRGFSDRDSTALNASSFTFESSKARLDQDVALSDLNGGQGVRRGVIEIVVGGTTTEVDLSKTGTIAEVIEAINGSDAGVTATTVGSKLVLTSDDNSQFQVRDKTGGDTARDLKINAQSNPAGRLEGGQVFVASNATSLDLLNDGAGVDLTESVGNAATDFTITIDGTTVDIFLGEVTETTQDDDGEDVTTVVKTAVQDIGDVIERVNEQLADAGYTDVTLALDVTNGSRLVVNDTQLRAITVANETGVSATTTATDLGIEGSVNAGQTLTGRQVFGALNSTLTSSLNGGSGIASGSTIDITDRSGASTSIDISGFQTLSEIIDAINGESGVSVTASINDLRTGITLTDASGGGGAFIIAGQGATDLGLATGPGGVASASVDSGDLERRYVTANTLLEDLNDGSGIGTGTFSITDATGQSRTFDVGDNESTVGDLIQLINSNRDGLQINARLNDTGDGLLIEDTSTGGTQALSIEDVSGRVAGNLNLAGTAKGTGADNFIDGSQELTIEFDPTDTLDDIVSKLNEPGRFVRASILTTGDGSTPFRLSLSSRASGTAGEFILDTNGFDLGLSTLTEGQDARVFFGSADPAKGLILTSSTNTLDNVVPGVTINLNSTSEEPVELTIARNVDEITSQVKSLFDGVNTILNSIDTQTRFDQETGARGPLLGDSTLFSLQRDLVNAVTGVAQNVPGALTRLSEVGITIGEGGRVTFDEADFRAAYSDDPASVEALIAEYVLQDDDEIDDGLPEGVEVTGGTDEERVFSSLGFAGILEEIGLRYTDPIDGILSRREDTLDTQIELQESRVESLNRQLAAREAQLAADFLVMERAIGQLQTQQASLSQIAFIG